MSNSSLVDCTVLSPNHSGKRTHKIDRITPHCYVGQVTVKRIGEGFSKTDRQASCNYGIDKDGKVILVVDEDNRSWCSSSRDNDQRAITIECASDTVAPYTMKNEVYNKLVELSADICRRNGIDTLLWIDDKEKALSYEPKSNEAIITVHRWFANKECPGDWLYDRLGELANEVTNILSHYVLYRVQVGAFKNKLNATALKYKLKIKGYDAFIVSVGEIYKVQVGAYRRKENAIVLRESLKDNGYEAFIRLE